MHTKYTDVIYRMEGYFIHGELSLLPTPVSSTNKTDDHDIAEILLKVALNTISLANFATNHQIKYKNIFTTICQTIRMLFNFSMVVSFIGGRNRSTRRKPPTCHKSLSNFIK
jgi:hypothetical protein